MRNNRVLKRGKRVWAVLLSLMLIVGLLPAGVFADGGAAGQEALTVSPALPREIYAETEVTLTLGTGVSRPPGSDISDEITFLYESNIPGAYPVRSVTPAGQEEIDRVLKFTIPSGTKPGAYYLTSPQAIWYRYERGEGRPPEEYKVAYPDSAATPASVPIVVSEKKGVVHTYEFCVASSLASAEFYVCDGFDEDGYDIPGERLDAVDKGLAWRTPQAEHHIYELTAAPGTAVSFRGKDKDGVPIGGMTVTLPDDDYDDLIRIYLKEVNYYFDNTVRVENEDELENENENEYEYLTHEELFFKATYDDGKRVTLAEYNQEGYDENGYYSAPGWRGFMLTSPDVEYTYEAFAVEEAAERFKVVDLLRTGQVIDYRTGAETLRLRLPFTTKFGVTAPSDAKVQAFYTKNVNHCNVAMTEVDTRENADGTVTHVFDSKEIPIRNQWVGTVSYRVERPGYITKAGYGDVDVKVTFPDEPDGDTEWAHYDRTNDGGAVRYGEDNILLNINGQNYLTLPSVGSEFKARAYRTWQIIDSDWHNAEIPPVFRYEVVSGNSVTVTRDETYPQWAYIRAVRPGLSVVEVTYGATDVANGSLPGLYNAIQPNRKGRILVNVGGDPGDIKLNLGVWDCEADTVYFTGDEGEFTFNPTSKSGEVSVEARGDGEEFEAVSANGDGSFTVPVKDGNNDVRVFRGEAETYFLLRGQKTEIVVQNLSHPNQELGPYDRIRISFSEMHTPIPKMGGVYNGSAYIQYTDEATGRQVIGTWAKYTFSYNHGIDAILDGNGYLKLSGGKVWYSTSGDNWGDHRDITDDGRGPGTMSAWARTGCILPDIEVQGTREGDFLGPEVIYPLEVRASFGSGGEGFGMARKPLTVMPGVAAEYGYGYATSLWFEDVTALDVLVAAHIDRYGTDEETIHDKLEVNAGSVSKAFGQALPDQGRFVFTVNGEFPHDGVAVDTYVNGLQYTAEPIGGSLVEGEDVIEFFVLQDAEGGSDEFAWFESGGERAEEVSVEEGGAFELTLKSYPVLSSALSVPEDRVAATHPVSGAAILPVDKDVDSGSAVFGDAPLAVTDAEGKVELRFDEPGVYVISAVGAEGEAPLLSPWCTVTVNGKAGAENGKAKTVYLSVEKFTIGRGFVQAPIAVKVRPGDNVAKILKGALPAYQNGGTVEAGFYLSGIKDDDAGAVNVPPYIQRRLDRDGYRLRGRLRASWLMAYDYSDMSGWMYAVNGRMPGVGMSDYTYGRLRDGDVIRVQFTLYGSGRDIADGASMNGGAYRDLPNRDDLLRALATVNSAANRDELLASGTEIQKAYAPALEVVANLEASKAAIDGALLALDLALKAEYTSPDEDDEDDDTVSDKETEEEYPTERKEAAEEKVTVTAPDFLIRFSPEGGRITKGPASISVRNGERYNTLPTAARTGYSFVGWFTAKIGGARIQATSVVSLKADQILYAHWAAKKFTVKFNVNKGKKLKKAKASKQVTYAAKYGKLVTPTRKGYKFTGWYTKKKGGKKISARSKVTVTKNTTLYAHWKKKRK